MLWQTLREEGVRAAVQQSRAVVGKHGIEAFHPAILNQIGRSLLAQARCQDARVLFERNVELYPEIPQLQSALDDARRRCPAHTGSLN